MNFELFKQKVAAAFSSVKEGAKDAIAKHKFEELIKDLYVDGVLTEEEKAFAMAEAVKYGIMEEEAKLIIAIQERKLTKKEE